MKTSFHRTRMGVYFGPRPGFFKSDLFQQPGFSSGDASPAIEFAVRIVHDAAAFFSLELP